MTLGRALPVPNARPVRGARAYGADRPRSGPERGRRRHAGVDLAAAPGTPVGAPEAGRVVVVARSTPAPPGAAAWPATRPWSGYGPGLVVIEGESGRFHLLAHLEWPANVLVDELVREGELVGLVSHLAHVHWEVRTELRRPSADVDTVAITLDPLAWLDGRDVEWSPASSPAPDDAPRAPAPERPELGPRRELQENRPRRRRSSGVVWVLIGVGVVWALSKRRGGW